VRRVCNGRRCAGHESDRRQLGAFGCGLLLVLHELLVRGLLVL
jgi:hypothetical protein